MKRIAMTLSALALSAPLAAWADGAVIATSGQASVTQSDITTIVKTLDPATRMRLAANPAQLDQVVRNRLAVAAVVAEAKSKGWDKKPEVKQMMDEAQREALMQSYMASVNAPPADYPSEQDMQAAYDQNKSTRFVAPRALHFAQIYIPLPPNTDAATLDRVRKQAVEVARQAHASGADFAALAKADSQDKASAVQGGDMGFVPETGLLPEIRKATDGMKPGDVSQAIQTGAGFHVVKLIETRPAGVVPYAQVKEQIRAALRQQRGQQNAQAYLMKIAGPATVAINEDALKKALNAAQ